MCVCVHVSTRSTLKITGGDKDQKEWQSALLGCCCVTHELACLLEMLVNLKCQHLAFTPQDPGVLVGVAGISRQCYLVPCCGQSSLLGPRVLVCAALSSLGLGRASLCCCGSRGTQLVSSCLVRRPKAFGRTPCTAASLSRLLLLALFALWIPPPLSLTVLQPPLSLFMRDSGPFSRRVSFSVAKCSVPRIYGKAYA